MPYISLQDQGFYQPFDALRQGANDFWQLRRQRKEFEQEKQDREMRRDLLSRQMDEMTREGARKEADASFTPRSVTLPDGTTAIETSRGRYEIAKKDPPSLLDRLLPKVTQPATPAPDQPARPTPSAPQDQSVTPTPESPVVAGQPPTGPAAPPPTGGIQIPGLGAFEIIGFDANGQPMIRRPEETEETKIEPVPVPGGEPITAEVTRRGGRIIRITPINLNRADANKPVGDDAMAKFGQAAFALGQLPDIETAVNTRGTSGGPLEGRVRRLFDYGLGQNPTDLEFSNLAARTLAPIAKGILGETGVLSDQDIKRIEPLLPQYTDTEVVRKVKLEKLRTMLTEQTTRWLSIMRAAGRKTEGLEKAMAPMIEAAGGQPGPKPTPVSSQAEYDALPPGAPYTDSTGKVKIKQ